MARSTAPAVVSSGALPAAIKSGFAHIYSHESQIAALKAKHITPLADEVTATWRGLKKDTGIERKDLKLFYDIYKRQRMAEDLADELDRERILDNLRMAFNALQQGEMLSFLEALEAADQVQAAHDGRAGAGDGQGDDEADDDGATGSGGWDEGSGPAPMASGDGEGEFPADDEVDGPVADAGAEAAVHDPEAEEALAGGGAVYNEGAQAAFDGRAEADNPYAEGKDAADATRAGLWAAGYGDTIGMAPTAEEAAEEAFAGAEQQDEGEAEEVAGASESEAEPVAEQQEGAAAEVDLKEYPVYGADGEVVDVAPSPDAWVARAIEVVATLDDVEEIKAFAAANERHVSPLMPLADWQTLTVPLIDAIAERRKAASKVVKAVFGAAPDGVDAQAAVH
ncbi:hypothetical protein ACM64Y_00530 [Novispirillum sp. DQ9]|uniref:hypothetical protein n=1 Tax=Novispirillum sp. DQ9 TaxID=3398612 RepID=UPI003C7A587A